ncbi:hypothetical protein [Ruegeria atlantica]|uniref:hypothetical protein n=1 Tax=Ruegeria atlantica TaxID=81569 RepID=UPI00147B9463|nr:hypothetical protein [Ruegeria atlantica]
MSANLRTPSARARLTARREPYYSPLDKGLALGFYVGAKGGRWTARTINPAGRPKWLTTTLAPESDLTFAEACDRARAWAADTLADAPADDPTPTVRQAVDSWVAGKRRASGDLAASKTLAGWVGAANSVAAFLGENVRLSDVSRADLERYRDRPASRGAVRSRATGNRDLNAAKAMLTAGANDPDLNYQGPRAWQDAKRHDTESTARVDDATDATAEALGGRVLSLDDMRLFLESAEVIDPAFATFCRVMFLTMQRPHALRMANVSDLMVIDGRPMLRLRFGKNAHKRRRRVGSTERTLRIELFDEVAAILFELAEGRPANAPLLTDSEGNRWPEDFQRLPFQQSVEVAGIDPEGLTFYTLRHSGITWAATPAEHGGGGLDAVTVAQCADTSLELIARTYYRRQTGIGTGPGL